VDRVETVSKTRAETGMWDERITKRPRVRAYVVADRNDEQSAVVVGWRQSWSKS